MADANTILDSKLREIFGYTSFNPHQREIIKTIRSGRDCLAILPTGSGKSLCYQLPAILSDDKLAIVVSPLISLMKDQVLQLNQLGEYAVLLNSSLSREDYRENLSRIVEGQVRILYVAPETLMKPHILDLLEGVTVSFLTIDEAHCISEWGHDFRPEYRQLATLRERFPGLPVLALTATATKRVREDIVKNLHMKNPALYVASFDRPNLFLEVEEKNSPFRQLTAFLEKFPDQSGIVYCASRKETEQIVGKLTKQGVSALPYHAGMSAEKRNRNQEAFIRDDVSIIVATIAFGMGINKPDVRFVVHYDLPKNIESYYQQIGRAGRDGLPAHCLLLLGYGDISKIRYFINQKEDEKEKRIANNQLSVMLGFAEATCCRRIPLLHYFGENYQKENCGACDNCLDGGRGEARDLTVEAQKFMSCVWRTGQMFGMGYIINVLRGSTEKRVVQNGHDKLSTWGIGKGHSKQAWQQLGRQLIAHGLLSQDPAYGGLKLTAAAWPVLRSGKSFLGQMNEGKKPEEARLKKAAALNREDVLADPATRNLFEELRQKRKELADEMGMPPYVVFSDRTLIEMAKYRPSTLAEMMEIHGVGAVKLERYGSIFLPIISK
ncbi:MAG: DNA helicase RecQ [Acidobacteria bacterium]|nr:MAG: DNA helicase RecQ [Acidobacteriota bacterium]